MVKRVFLDFAGLTGPVVFVVLERDLEAEGGGRRADPVNHKSPDPVNNKSPKPRFSMPDLMW